MWDPHIVHCSSVQCVHSVQCVQFVQCGTHIVCSVGGQLDLLLQCEDCTDCDGAVLSALVMMQCN